MAGENNPLGLGELCKWDRPRDAVHIAVIPVVAGDEVSPGQAVWIDTDGRAYASTHGIGVVDPFLYKPVQAGERFWLFMRPGTVTSLRHEWHHPDVPMYWPTAGAMAESAAWLANFAATRQVDYAELVEGAMSGSGACFGVDQHGPLGNGESCTAEEALLFWRHMEVLTGQQYDAVHRTTTSFSCSC